MIKPTPEDTARSGKISNRLPTVFIFLLAFIAYCLTACRTVYTGDDGDFATAITTLGIPHPTGYPLFILLGKLWTLATPFLGEIAFRINIFTALCGAAAVAGLYRFTTEFLDTLPWNREWAATAALLFGFGPTLWSQSTSCEVYALNVFFLTLLLNFSLRFFRREHGDRADKDLCILALVYGFALTNHLSSALFFPVFLVLVLFRKPSLFGKHWQVLLAVSGCFLLPLSLYAYIPLATKYSTSFAKWGYPDTFPRFWQHLTGAQYQSQMFTSSSQWLMGAQRFFLGYLPSEYNVLLIAAAVFGAIALLSRSRTRPHAILLLAIFTANIIYAAGYAIDDIFVYYIPSYLVIAVFIAGAGAFFVNWLQTRFAWDRTTVTRYARLALPILMVGVAANASLHYAQSDKSDNRVEADYAESILRSCPKDAVLAVRGPVADSLWYYQFVRKERPDVLVISQDLFPAVSVMGSGGWYRAQLRRFDHRIDNYLPITGTADDYNQGKALVDTLRNALSTGRPVVVVPTPDISRAIQEYQQAQRSAHRPVNLPDWWFVEQSISKGFDRVPWGLTERLYIKGQMPSVTTLFPELAPVWVGHTDSIQPDYARLQLAINRNTDPLQVPYFFRFHESLVHWGRMAEAAGRPDLAISAYQHALMLFNDKTIRAALEKLQAQNGSIPAP